jgi:predicted protein tyrosine phosphatase
MRHDPDWVKLVNKSIKVTEDRSEIKVDYSNIKEMIHGRPVLGKILILPRADAVRFQYNKPWACVSIGCDEDFPHGMSEDNRKDFLRLEFADLEGMSEPYKEHLIACGKPLPLLFTADHAKKINQFVESVWDEIDLLLVHCRAGLSRSTAVGKALSKKYDQPHEEFYDKLYIPNKLVYRLMLESMAGS